MIQTPIYQPSGRAREYGELAVNIYTGCNHRCAYCFAPNALQKQREIFHTVVEPRREIVESVKRQINREGITGKMIHLCFACDPYPADIDTTPTREIIAAIKNAGNHVQILTKGGKRALRDFDLLDSGDWFGVTISGHALNMHEIEPRAANRSERGFTLAVAANRGIKTWVSFEPVLDARTVFDAITGSNYIDLYRIGKLNYHSPEDYGAPPIDWDAFGRDCERLCIAHGRNYYIKEALRKEMEGGSNV